MNSGERTIQIKHQHLRVPDGGTSSSMKLDACVKVKVQGNQVWVGPTHLLSSSCSTPCDFGDLSRILCSHSLCLQVFLNLNSAFVMLYKQLIVKPYYMFGKNWYITMILHGWLKEVILNTCGKKFNIFPLQWHINYNFLFVIKENIKFCNRVNHIYIYYLLFTLFKCSNF